MDGLAVSGRVRLYRGDIAGALTRFKAAGPYAGDREEATERTDVDGADPANREGHSSGTGARAPSAGAGRHRGSRCRFGAGRRRASRPSRVGPSCTCWRDGCWRPSGKPADAERLFRAAARQGSPGDRPAAELALAELLISSQRTEEAVSVLEHLILTYPESALVPQARRELDEARGAVPKT